MSNDKTIGERILGEESRRSFMKKSTVASVAFGAGVLGSGVGGAQDFDLDDNWKALIFADSFHPEARFTFVSGVVEWTPNYGDVRDSWFSDFNTYQIRWLNTDEVVPLFVAEDANIGREYDQELGFIPDADDDANQPQLFEMEKEWTPFGDNPRLVEVEASPVAEEQEDEILENEDWWQTGGGNQTATNTTTTNGG
ncbi:twin-arginine translocation signal domain-containing protein [Halorussus salinisoli]|uniref:twin-arginine translocation signal domain-containing protein n=1 Tax=Halorussus salinisoli TaxID=2558242 RepID=UPI0010C1DFB5|nr:twin-arginine translocation signal domain-containing protein [Halorussus salinisoli]